MIDLTGVEHHRMISELSGILCKKLGVDDPKFFHSVVAFFGGKAASNMRATIVTQGRGKIPVNLYTIGLAPSGYGKGHSIGIMEEQVLAGFRYRFTQETMPYISDKTMWATADERAELNKSDAQEERDKLEKTYVRQGGYAFTFDGGTSPAVKQLRYKLLMAGIGAINLQVDEIGSNLIATMELLNLFLELYDQGRVKAKLTKHAKDNLRDDEVEGKSPANLLAFGTAIQLFDGGLTEAAFNMLLQTGYARRCLFGWGTLENAQIRPLTAREIYLEEINPVSAGLLQAWSDHFFDLADPSMHNWEVSMDEEVSIALIQYRMDCELKASQFMAHEEVRKAEMAHRYFKTMKVAGTYAFVDKSPAITMDHLLSAILLVEESGVAFNSVMKREKNHVKLAKYIATCGQEVTHSDLLETLPFYKTTVAGRKDMMDLAIAWGYKNNVIIKKSFSDSGIEFIKGETLTETNINELIISYSDDYGEGFLPELAPFDQLHLVTQAPGIGWCNHHFQDEIRREDHVLPGFNVIVLDVDGDISMNAVHEIFKDTQFMTYTTKRHQLEEHGSKDRFRLIFPINYVLEMTIPEYKEFMASFMEFMPFKSDEAAKQRSKKWLSNPKGTFYRNTEGSLMDILPFIPKTSRNEKHRESRTPLASLGDLERWFAPRMVEGDRNNQMAKYAFALVDSGMDPMAISKAVHAFNAKLASPMDEDRINNTIMMSVAKKFSQKAT